MKFAACLGICMLAIAAPPFVSGFWFGSKPSVRFPGLQNNQYMTITNRINELEGIVLQLIDKITSLLPSIFQPHSLKCPSTVPSVGTGNSKVIGTYCYYVDTNAVPFTTALLNCQSFGGTLAEPMYAFSTPLYTALKAAFSAQLTAIEATNTGKLWIGAKSTPASPAVILYLSTNQPVPGAIAATAQDQGALLTKPGIPWTVDVQTKSYPYVCQITALT